MPGQLLDVGVGQHDVEGVEVLGQTANFDVRPLTDDHRMITVAQKRLEGPVGDVDERTGGLDDGEAACSGAGERSFGGAVRRHHYRGRRHLRHVARDGDAAGPKVRQDRRVVDEISQDRERPGVGVRQGEIDRVPDAKTHAQMAGSEDFHDTHATGCSRRLLCITK